ncbi:hypothetical protein OHB01_11450 [Microbispora hainanensis]|jgi:hypothetical protein|uniref:Uncharacterized protein n=1 Tax=Microbispora hainanensis TaxID=568844 RepID=A0ABZ1SKS4_9ACTN|nr:MULTISPECIES: hypothetical protein [Microbispora]NJP27801.1 hypothetical protein [Microbispora sp. CL1-1]TQS10573.1 hypothetical protein FLW53_27050 [Microbispora sp. SCL1-1]
MDSTDPELLRQVAVMAAGRVMFTDPVTGIVDRAQGATWEVVTRGTPPATGVVVSAVGGPDGTRYRVVSQDGPDPAAVPVRPSLEEG